MSDTTVSVVVVSRDRPAALKRCLTGLSQLQYPAFEVIVVSDPAGMAAAQAMSFADHLKLAEFDQPNISAARNLGVEHAAGDLVAFIDDDAVPEPQWLRHLVAPAAQADVAAMGGFVRGRNGISFQWRAQTLDADGIARPLDLHARQPTVLHPPKDRAIKTEGTNMAFRRDVLLQLGGFDPAFHYFLDETDLNMRLAREGHATAIVPLAEVHHGFAANRTRNANRVPRDLFDIGASWAVFLRKHVAPARHAALWQGIRLGQRRRLLRHMISGGLEPRDVGRLLQRLDAGHAEGQNRAMRPLSLAAHPRAAFKPFPARHRDSVLLVTRPISARKTRQEAEDRVRDGQIVTVLDLSPTTLYHHLRFDEAGFWLQKGGIFGKSDRRDPIFRLTTRAKRVQTEHARVAIQRGLGKK